MHGMKMQIPSIIAICCLAVATPAFGKKKGNGNHPEAATQPQPATPKAPSEELAAFLGTHLDKLLSPFDTGEGERRQTPNGVVNRETDMKFLKVSETTRAEVTKLDQQFRANASAATPADLPVCQRAVAVTTILTQLMDERDRQTSIFINSRTTRPLSELDKQKTQHQRKNARQEIHETKNFMSTGLEQQWLQTANQYRQQVNAQMDVLRATERQTRPANPSGSGTPPAGTR